MFERAWLLSMMDLRALPLAAVVLVGAASHSATASQAVAAHPPSMAPQLIPALVHRATASVADDHRRGAGSGAADIAAIATAAAATTTPPTRPGGRSIGEVYSAIVAGGRHLASGVCLTVEKTDEYGDGWNGAVCKIVDESGTTVYSGTV